jgi:hypothetical protein
MAALSVFNQPYSPQGTPGTTEEFMAPLYGLRRISLLRVANQHNVGIVVATHQG